MSRVLRRLGGSGARKVVGIAGEEVAAIERLVKSEVLEDRISQAVSTAGHARLALAPSRSRRRAP
ncbi:hypothetical protein [Knoellia aerolata]|uniref:hypothetical protein n=1 Tax=Knoellia aerolata TaxID=442954 RepID=UPI000A61199B|nr:hypothetical protein [Knoellia aerolata]